QPPRHARAHPVFEQSRNHPMTNRNRFYLRVLSVLSGGVFVCFAAVSASAADKKTEKKPSQAAQDNYAEIFAKYLAEARRQAQSAPVESNRWMNSLMT